MTSAAMTAVSGCKAGAMALRFEIKKPGIKWTGVAVDLVGAATGGGTSGHYTGKTKVVAFNDAGKQRILQSVDSERIAEDRRVAIQNDYQLLSIEAWCRKYEVPTEFAEG
jgi:hypothetical protein